MTPTDLEILIRAHQAQVMRYLRYLGATTEEQVEELTQQTFVAAFDARNVPPLDDDARRAAWLRGIAANRFLRSVRDTVIETAAGPVSVTVSIGGLPRLFQNPSSPPRTGVRFLVNAVAGLSWRQHADQSRTL